MYLSLEIHDYYIQLVGKVVWSSKTKVPGSPWDPNIISFLFKRTSIHIMNFVSFQMEIHRWIGLQEHPAKGQEKVNPC